MLYRLAKTAPDGLILLPESALDKLESAGLTEIRVLLCAAAKLSRGPLPEEELTEALLPHFSGEDLRAALAFWRGCGVLETDGGKPGKRYAVRTFAAPDKPEKKLMPDPDTPPFYSGMDLENAAKSNPDYKNLVDFMEKRLDKVFNTGELATIWSYLDYMKMPADVVMLIAEDCCERGHGNLRYITKAVISFQDQGLTSYEKANAYYLAQTQKEKFARKIKKLFGMGDRTLTRTEDAHLAEWMGWNFSDEMLDLAYEKTVSAAAKPSINYMHKILLNWHQEGIATPGDAERYKPSKKAEPGQVGDKSYDLDAAFEKAVQRQRKDL